MSYDDHLPTMTGDFALDQTGTVPPPPPPLTFHAFAPLEALACMRSHEVAWGLFTCSHSLSPIDIVSFVQTLNVSWVLGLPRNRTALILPLTLTLTLTLPLTLTLTPTLQAVLCILEARLCSLVKG
jgi:hypothetical protein